MRCPRSASSAETRSTNWFTSCRWPHGCGVTWAMVRGSAGAATRGAYAPFLTRPAAALPPSAATTIEPIRRFYAAAAVLAAVLGAVLLVAPVGAAGWALSPLTGGTVRAFLVGFGLAAALALRENDLARLRGVAAARATLGVLELLAVAINSEDLAAAPIAVARRWSARPRSSGRSSSKTRGRNEGNARPQLGHGSRSRPAARRSPATRNPRRASRSPRRRRRAQARRRRPGASRSSHPPIRLFRRSPAPRGEESRGAGGLPAYPSLRGDRGNGSPPLEIG